MVVLILILEVYGNRGLWKENLLRSSEELADEYIEYTLKDEDSYSYLDKQTYEYIPISE